MEFRILGSFEVVGTSGPIDLRGAKRRGLLACLVVHAGQAMGTDRLVEELWGERGAEGAGRTVQTYVSQLRKLLGGESARLETHPGGYVLDVGPADVDARRFEEALAATGDDGDPARQLASLDGALGLWRGPPLGEFAGAGWADREAARLEALRLDALQRRYNCLLDLGRAGEAVTGLETLVCDHPLDERLWGQLMLALYRSGRQADALGAYRRARRHLVDELGIEPGPALAELEHRILVKDSALTAPYRAAVDGHSRSMPGLADGWYPRTFLLTDIVDSVSLWERDPAAMSQAVARHDAVILDAVGAAGGDLVRSKGEGDSTFAMFERPADALSAAGAIQQALVGEPWPSTVALRVRVGVHTGEAEHRRPDWYGPVVNRAARLRSLADGGQTLVSGVTAGLAADQLPETLRLLYLGRRLLRGIERPEEVWELVAADDPRLATSTSVRVGDLPVARTSFVGHAEDLDHLDELVQAERLITLTGPGGSGKTRLALEVARRAQRRGRRVWLVELATLRDGELVAQAVATAIGVETGAAGADPLDDLLVRPERLAGLLVLDNCEHVLPDCATLAERLLAAPDIRLLATSREPLRLPGEQEWPVRPLDVPEESPPDPAVLAQVESVQLLIDRARAVRPDLEVGDDDVTAVVRICRALDGIPLALELAAARLRSLGFRDLETRLNDQMALLARSGARSQNDDRHRTLRVTLDWSYELLTDDQRTVAEQLSVFEGGFRLDAAEAVCGDDLHVLDNVDELVAKSLVSFDPPTARYRLLEPLRQYLAERLDESGETEAVRRAHAAWVVTLAEAAERGFFTNQAMWARRLRAEESNIRAALVGAVDRGDGITALRIGASLGYPWFTMGQPDARSLLDRALAAAGPVDDRLRARALVAAGMLAQDATEHDVAEPLLEEALDLFRATRSRRGQAWALTWLARRPGPHNEDGGRDRHEQALALFRETHHAPGIAWSLSFLAILRVIEGDVEGARQYAEEALAAARQAGTTQPMAEALRVLGQVALREWDLAEARRRLEEAVEIQRSVGDRWQEAVTVSQVGNVAALMGGTPAALDHYARSVDLVDEIASPDQLAQLLQGFVLFLWDLGHRHRAAQLLGAYDARRSWYNLDLLREVAERVHSSDLEAARIHGTRLSFDEAIVMIRRAIDDVRTRHGIHNADQLPASADTEPPPSGE
jgi:predicted ATPase/DNA-binding SARP family transcriptional activator